MDHVTILVCKLSFIDADSEKSIQTNFWRPIIIDIRLVFLGYFSIFVSLHGSLPILISRRVLNDYSKKKLLKNI